MGTIGRITTKDLKVRDRGNFRIISLTAPNIARSIARELKITNIPVESTLFNSGEPLVEIGTCPEHTLRDKHVFMIATANTGRIMQDCWLNYQLLHTAEKASASKIDLIYLFMPFLRQERRTKPRTSLTANFFMDLLRASAPRSLRSVITFDPHTSATEAIIEKDGLIGHGLSMKSLFVDYIRDKYRTKGSLENVMMGAPDFGRMAFVKSIAKDIFGPKDYQWHLFAIEKTRIGERTHMRLFETRDAEGRGISTLGKDVIFIDDMIDTGGTLMNASQMLAENRFTTPRSISCFAIHPVLSKNALLKIEEDSFINHLIVMNTLDIPGQEGSKKLEVIQADRFIAKIIARIANGNSLSDYGSTISPAEQ